MNAGINDSVIWIGFIHEAFWGNSYKSRSTEDAYTVYLFYMFVFILACLPAHIVRGQDEERSMVICQCTRSEEPSAQLLIVIFHSFRVRREASSFLPGWAWREWRSQLYHSPGDLSWTQRTFWAVSYSDTLTPHKVTWEEGHHFTSLWIVYTQTSFLQMKLYYLWQIIIPNSLGTWAFYLSNGGNARL